MIKKFFKIKNMTCSACSAKIENILEKNKIRAKVNFISEKLIVEYDDSIHSEDYIKNIVKSIGYELVDDKSSRMVDENNNKLYIIGFFTVIIMVLSMGHMINLNIHINMRNAIIQFLITTSIIIFSRYILIDGISKIFKIEFNMNTLISVGVISSYLYSTYNLINNDLHKLYFEGVCVIIFVVLLGKKIESNLKKNTNETISKLSNLIPSTCYILENGSIIKILTKDIKKDDILVLKAGQIAPVDGIIESGSASFDENVITGESRYILKNIGDEVISSSIVVEGNVNVKVTKVGEDTLISKIINIVELAGEIKPPITKYIDKISLYFVPSIFFIAVITFVYWYILTGDFSKAINHFVTILVIACPCSIGLATPTSIIVSAGVLAKNNILIKDGVALEKSYKITDIIMDKTGTITNGTPQVIDILLLEKNNMVDIYNIEKYVEHPISKAITKYIKANYEILEKECKVRTLNGMGVMSDNYVIGNETLMKRKNIDISILSDKYLEYSNEGKTVIFVAYDNKIIGLLTLIDDIRETSYKFINKKRRNDIKFSILTGDNINTSKYIANKLNVKDVNAQVLPYEKSKYVEQKLGENRVVAMVGDGINDTPAFTVADISIAVGSGVDIALKTCDVILMKNDLNDIDKLIKMSKYTMLNIKENLFWGFIYNIFGVVIATGVFKFEITPMLAAIFMMLSSISVLLNAIKLKFKKL
ncbi:heavy metal translocating P-type ATPase [Caviibacter abscessus]|uniref:heavy metal translocating P-type ATPase n=1 Tax=Caviibacter abscessus TaxID=1766719 RepID=UPI0008380D74|nr:cation-translocating P-type ATPase [Caviibacter abscessus]